MKRMKYPISEDLKKWLEEKRISPNDHQTVRNKLIDPYSPFYNADFAKKYQASIEVLPGSKNYYDEDQRLLDELKGE